MEPREPTIATAIVRPPGPTFAQGITRAGLGPPDLERALAQHAAYAEALEAAGVRLVRLPADPAHPDSTFVEDTAVILGREAILTRPGAESRRGEVDSIRAALLPLVASLEAIEPPGTLDGGDVLETDRGFLIGISERTNEAGARRLAEWLAARGRPAHLVAIGGMPGLLHLKTGIGCVARGLAAAVPALAPAARAIGLDVIPVEPEEAYAANAVRVNGRVLLPSGAPGLSRLLRERGCAVVTLEMSEFEKMDGGLSCLSLRLPAGRSVRPPGGPGTGPPGTG